MSRAAPDFLRLFLVIAFVTVAEAALAQQPAPPASPNTANPPEAQGPAKPLPSATETPAVVVDGNVAQTVLGKPVRSANGEDLGRVVDVIVDRGGVVQAAIIDFGGFLGVGTRKIAVDWHALRFPDGGPLDKLIANLQREQLRKAPAYKEGEPIVIMGRTAPSAAPASSPPAPESPPDPSASPPKAEQPTAKP